MEYVNELNCAQYIKQSKSFTLFFCMQYSFEKINTLLKHTLTNTVKQTKIL